MFWLVFSVAWGLLLRTLEYRQVEGRACVRLTGGLSTEDTLCVSLCVCCFILVSKSHVQHTCSVCWAPSGVHFLSLETVPSACSVPLSLLPWPRLLVTQKHCAPALPAHLVLYPAHPVPGAVPGSPCIDLLHKHCPRVTREDTEA